MVSMPFSGFYSLNNIHVELFRIYYGIKTLRATQDTHKHELSLFIADQKPDGGF
jgi:hypothetical protein